ncbi:MAG: tRNA pseudouridine(38-40) synthase TruA [Gemmatimonadetes bacterium]|nr:tRNA pseudouridine(38-40) synthase TruA [Gemmatimonadota bacterium]
MSENETRFKLTLHYDGSAFHGWQVQPGQPTVQGALEAVISRITGEHRTVTGAGRTDTGVHATGQVAAVTVPGKWTSRTLVRALNSLLPRGVWVQGATRTDPGFQPRFDAVARSYSYRVGTVPEAASPFHRRWCWPLGRALDLEAASRTAESIRGEHEFHAFAKAGQSHRGHRCRVTKARWQPWGELGAVFEITANRFLHRMVRYLVGTMVDIALGRRKEEDMVLLLGDSEPLPGDSALTTSPPAPPEGLFLTGVEYPATARGDSVVNQTLHYVI